MLANYERERTTSELSGEPVLEYHRRSILAAISNQDLAGTQLCLINLVLAGKLSREQVAELYQLIAIRAEQLQSGANNNQINNSSKVAAG